MERDKALKLSGMVILLKIQISLFFGTLNSVRGCQKNKNVKIVYMNFKKRIMEESVLQKFLKTIKM